MRNASVVSASTGIIRHPDMDSPGMIRYLEARGMRQMLRPSDPLYHFSIPSDVSVQTPLGDTGGTDPSNVFYEIEGYNTRVRVDEGSTLIDLMPVPYSSMAVTGHFMDRDGPHPGLAIVDLSRRESTVFYLDRMGVRAPRIPATATQIRHGSTDLMVMGTESLNLAIAGESGSWYVDDMRIENENL